MWAGKKTGQKGKGKWGRQLESRIWGFATVFGWQAISLRAPAAVQHPSRNPGRQQDDRL